MEHEAVNLKELVERVEDLEKAFHNYTEVDIQTDEKQVELWKKQHEWNKETEKAISLLHEYIKLVGGQK